MGARILMLLAVCVLALAACGVVPRAAPHDPAIEDTVTEFDRAFQTFIVQLNRTAGEPAGEYAAHQAFYDRWKGELAHLRNRAIANDPADECPMSATAADSFQIVADATGTAGAAALGETDDLAAVAGAAIQRVEARLEDLSTRLNQPAGTLTPERADELRGEIAELEERRARLQRFSAAVAGITVEAPQGGCSGIVVAKLASQFDNFARFHQAQGSIGIPARARAPVILMNVTIQNVLKVQAEKRRLAGAGQP